MDDFEEELFACPECALKTKVIWDPGQTSREIDCIHCRRDINEMVLVTDEEGRPVLTDSVDKQGNLSPLYESKHSKTGCRYMIERGKGVK